MLDHEFFYIISVPVYILLLAVGIWRKARRGTIVSCSLFYFYTITLLAVTIFPIPIQGLDEIGKNGGMNNNFIPLMSIFDILTNERLDIVLKLRQVMGNVVLFIPLGFFVPLIWRNRNSFRKALPIGILSSVCIELLQSFISLLLGFNYKVTDVDDILLNTIGFCIGYLLWRIFRWGTEKI